MMNYDGLLSQLTDEKLSLFQGRSAVGVAVDADAVEGAIEEEQAATIQTVQQPCASKVVAKGSVKCASGDVVTATHSEVAAQQRKLSESSTPQRKIIESSTRERKVSESSTPHRKISASSRFMNAFQQLYVGATSSSSTAPAAEIDDSEATSNSAITTTAITNSAARTPSKGMESKLLSMWHNVKYGWSGKLKSNFSKEQPVWLLGLCYHRKYTPPSSMETSTEMSSSATNSSLDNKALLIATNAFESMEPTVPSSSGLYPPLDPGQVDEIVVPQELGMDAAENQVAEFPWEEGIEGFRRDFYSRIWMTYRREFPIMNGSNYTSDCGWGCMLRSGQMLLAQGLICHYLGRSWRYDPDTQLHSTFEDNIHRKIIKWFGDSSSKSSPFSIHALVSLGEKMGKKPGDWYGPASVSFLLKQALKNASQENADFDNITIYVAKDCTIFIQDVENECRIPESSPKKHVPWQAHARKQETPKTEKQHWKSLIVLIPLRLGTEKLNPVYAHCLKWLLSTEYCIGIIGGRPKHSLYFVGFQEDKLIHLDPHYCQEMVDVNQENFPLHSFHCKSPRKLKTAKMDPSCCIGFYFQTKTDFEKFVKSVQSDFHSMRCPLGNFDKNASTTHPTNTPTNDGSNTNTQYTEMTYPFTFSRGRCLDNELDEMNMSDSYYKPVQRQLDELKSELGMSSQSNFHNVVSNCDDENDETEEFVLL